MILFLLFLLLWATPGWAITFDALTRVAASSTTSISTNHTIGGSCTNTIVAASLGFYDNGGLTVSSFTIGGSAATHIATESGTVNRATAAYYRVGQSGTIAVAVTLSSGSDKLSLSVRSYCNVDQTTPIGTAVKDREGDFSGGDPNLAVSSAVGELVIDFGAAKNNDDNTLTVGASQTQRLNTDSNDGYFTHFESEEAGGATVDMTWSQAINYSWSYIAVPLKPETPPAPPSGGRRRLTQGSMSE